MCHNYLWRNQANKTFSFTLACASAVRPINVANIHLRLTSPVVAVSHGTGKARFTKHRFLLPKRAVPKLAITARIHFPHYPQTAYICARAVRISVCPSPPGVWGRRVGGRRLVFGVWFSVYTPTYK